jgi:hypothetical protein
MSRICLFQYSAQGLRWKEPQAPGLGGFIPNAERPQEGFQQRG